MDRHEFDDFQPTGPGRKFQERHFANRLVDERAADGRGHGDVAFVEVLTVSKNQRVGFDSTRVLTLHHHARAKSHPVQRDLRHVDRRQLGKALSELPQTGLHELLPLQGGLVLRIFAKIAELDGLSDLVGEHDVEFVLELLDFFAEFLLEGFEHGRTCTKGERPAECGRALSLLQDSGPRWRIQFSAGGLSARIRRVIREERHGDVTRYELAGWRNRVVKLSVSIFEVRGVWIDTGFPRAAEAIDQLLATRRPRGVLITHRHEDHAGNAELLASRGVPLGMPALTAQALRAPLPVGSYRRETWGAPLPLRSPVTPFAPNDLELRASPGHSEDHHVIWDASTGTLFSADLFIGVRVSVAHSYEDPRRTIESLRTAASWGPARMFDAHRGLVKDPAGALNAKADWLEQVCRRIEDAVDAGVSDKEIARREFGRFDVWGAMSFGDYSQRNFVAAVRRGRQEQ